MVRNYITTVVITLLLLPRATMTYILPDAKRDHVDVCQLDLTLFQIPDGGTGEGYFISQLISENG